MVRGTAIRGRCKRLDRFSVVHSLAIRTHTFAGDYRLELDQTWTPVDRINDVDQKKLATKHTLQSKILINTLQSIDTNEATRYLIIVH